jgi:mono/diheme cytochrome c family protein
MRAGFDLDNQPKVRTLNEVGERKRRVAGRILMGAAIGVTLFAFAGSGTAASSASRAAGAELFKEKGCEHCHGPDGVGTDHGPSLMTVGKRLNKDQIEHQIREGGKQMPPFADVLNDDETHKLVDYLAHKKKAPKNMPGS